MEESAGGEEPPAFSVDEADARDEDSDDYSGLFDESEAAEQEEEIGWDTLGLPETQTTQMSLFDTDAYTQKTPADGQPVSSLSIQYSQEIVDEALRIGGFDHHSRLVIAAYFMKDKSLEENARFLREHYGINGAGFYHNDHPYSIWYDQEGIHLSSGDSAFGPRSHLISWDAAAIRIRELLDAGQYTSQDELNLALGNERHDLATSLMFLHGDFDEGARNQNLLPSITALSEKTRMFDPIRDQLIEMMNKPDTLQKLVDEMEGFVAAYAQDRDILRFTGVGDRFHTAVIADIAGIDTDLINAR